MNFPRNVIIANDSPGTHMLRFIFSTSICVTPLNLNYRGSIVVTEFVASVFSMRYKPLQALLRTIVFWCLCLGGGPVEAKGFRKVRTVAVASAVAV